MGVSIMDKINVPKIIIPTIIGMLAITAFAYCTYMHVYLQLSTVTNVTKNFKSKERLIHYKPGINIPATIVPLQNPNNSKGIYKSSTNHTDQETTLLHKGEVCSLLLSEHNFGIDGNTSSLSSHLQTNLVR